MVSGTEQQQHQTSEFSHNYFTIHLHLLPNIHLLGYGAHSNQITLNITQPLFKGFDGDKGGTRSNQIGANPSLGSVCGILFQQDLAHFKP